MEKAHQPWPTSIDDSKKTLETRRARRCWSDAAASRLADLDPSMLFKDAILVGGGTKLTDPDMEEFSRMIETAGTGDLGHEIDPDTP